MHPVLEIKGKDQNYMIYFINKYLELRKGLQLNPITIKVIDFEYFANFRIPIVIVNFLIIKLKFPTRYTSN